MLLSSEERLPRLSCHVSTPATGFLCPHHAAVSTRHTRKKAQSSFAQCAAYCQPARTTHTQSFSPSLTLLCSMDAILHTRSFAACSTTASLASAAPPTHIDRLTPNPSSSPLQAPRGSLLCRYIITLARIDRDASPAQPTPSPFANTQVCSLTPSHMTTTLTEHHRGDHHHQWPYYLRHCRV